MTAFTIRQAIGPEDLAAVRSLMRRYVAWHYRRHAAHRAMIDRYFDPTGFEAELAALPGRYAPPSGRLLLALVGAEPAGCVALRDLGDGACEMKRMFVAPEHQGRRLGLALGRRFLAEAGAAGYRCARLDTGPLQHEAHRLYARLGFRRIGAYYDLDPEMAGFLIFMERDLCGRERSLALGEELAGQGRAALRCSAAGRLSSAVSSVAKRLLKMPPAMSQPYSVGHARVAAVRLLGGRGCAPERFDAPFDTPQRLSLVFSSQALRLSRVLRS